MFGRWGHGPRLNLGSTLLLIGVALAPPPAGADAPVGAAVERVFDSQVFCLSVLDAFESLDPAVLKPLLAVRDVQLNLPASLDGTRRSTEGRFSADQAAILLRDHLQRDEAPEAPDLGPNAMVSPGKSFACLCQDLDPTESRAFLVLHYGLDRPAGRGRPAAGRLYLDLHLDRTGWRIRAVRDLR